MRREDLSQPFKEDIPRRNSCQSCISRCLHGICTSIVPHRRKVWNTLARQGRDECNGTRDDRAGQQHVHVPACNSDDVSRGRCLSARTSCTDFPCVSLRVKLFQPCASSSFHCFARALDSGDRPSPHFQPGFGDCVSLKLGAVLNLGSAFSDPRDGDVLKLRTRRAGACMMRCIVDMARQETAGKRPDPGAREA